MKYRMIALAVIFALLAGVIAEFGCTGPGLEFRIYEVEPVTVLPGYVQNIASTLFALNETPALNQTDELYYVSAEPYYLECCKNSSSIWYADESKAYNEFYEPAELPSEEDARDTANGFLASLIIDGVIPEGVEFEFFDVGETKTIVFDLATNDTITMINHLDVLYSFELESSELEKIPVEGPGAKIRVSIGDEEEVIGLHYVWREVKSFQLYPAITVEEAIEIFEETWEVEPETLEVELGYYAESEYDKQDFLQPYYIFDGTMKIDGEEVQFPTQLIPATTFSPIARIVSPDYDAEFPEGIMIDFEASVSGGEPPYKYSWESDVDGVIGEEASFSSNLSVAIRDGEVLPHAITLQVTDQNGNLAMAITSVKIVPAQSASILTRAPASEGTQTLSTNSPNDDDNDYEVGIEYVNDYPNHPLYFCGMCARGFRDKLKADGWDSKFTWKNSMAWEEDFKYRYDSDGGTDYLYIDAVDFAYFAGHGSPYRIRFCNPNHDIRSFYFSKARWGGNMIGSSGEAGDLEWIVLDACLTLKEYDGGTYVKGRWDQAFDGLHIVFGFAKKCHDVWDRGKRFAKNMVNQDRTIIRSWIRATQATEGNKVRGAYLRGSSETSWMGLMMEYASYQGTYWDHLPGHGYVSPDPYPRGYLIYHNWVC
jgi:hypothetical protein